MESDVHTRPTVIPGARLWGESGPPGCDINHDRPGPGINNNESSGGGERAGNRDHLPPSTLTHLPPIYLLLTVNPLIIVLSDLFDLSTLSNGSILPSCIEHGSLGSWITTRPVHVPCILESKSGPQLPKGCECI